MIITEAAQYLGVPADKIINELTRKHPEKAWKASSEVPDDFVEKAEQFADEYVKETAPQQLGGGQLTVSEAAEITSEAAEFGIISAMDECEQSFFSYLGKVSAMQQIQVFESSKAETWAKHYIKRDNAMNAQAERVEKQVQAFLPAAQLRQQMTQKLAKKNAATRSRIAKLPKL